MPYQVEQLLGGKGPLVSVTREDTVKQALFLMLEHDFSQLPVLGKDGDFDVADGMITYEGIIRGIRNFNLGIEVLKVRDVMERIFTCNGDDDLFDILDRVKETNAALVFNKDYPFVEGIITSYDITEYFRAQTEDLMRVEDIETTIKDLIKAAYTTLSVWGNDDVVDEEKLEKAARAVSYGKPKSFDKLSLAEYINLLTHPETWGFLESIIDLPTDAIKGLLNGIRESRNTLAHFRGDLSVEERDRLKFTVEWIARCQGDYQKIKEKKKQELLLAQLGINKDQSASQPETENIPENADTSSETINYVSTETSKSGGRYAALADWLQSKPGRINEITLTFNQVEEIIGSDLPDSARYFRAWWANDSVGHTHSQLWLDAGWRTTYVNLNEGRVTFNRIREREKAYIDFFGELLSDLRKNVNFPVQNASPDGANWIVIHRVPRSGQSFGYYAVSFSRTKKLRVELYIDLLDKDQTKQVFEQLLARKNEIEEKAGPLEWEKLDNRRASRVAMYKDGQITDTASLPELRKWAVEAIYQLFNATIEPAEQAMFEVKQKDVV